MIVKQPGPDARHRDKNGEIARKHGNTLVGTLRKIYGQTFAAGYPDSAPLSDVLQDMDQLSLSQLIEHHEAGMLEVRIKSMPK
jgi:hypothetical protein